MRPIRTTAICVLAAFTLGAVISDAGARNLEVSGNTFRATWASLEYTTTFSMPLRCALTIEGSFHERTIQKAANALIGAVTAPRVRHPCTNAELWAANGTEVLPNGRTYGSTLPWHLQYVGFSGTLPSMTSITLEVSRFRFLFQVPGICAGEYGEANDRWTMRANVEPGRAITNLEPIAGNAWTLVRTLTGICPGRLSFVAPAGDGAVTQLNSTTRILVRLI